MVSDAEQLEDLERGRAALIQAQRIMLAALCNVEMRAGGADRQLIVSLSNTFRRSEAGLAAKEAEQLDKLAWKYRRALPAHLAPKLPPHDPLVRALAQQAAAPERRYG